MYPWMALITYMNQIHCGGSLINNRYVLTAGHCVHRFSLAGLQVTLGQHELAYTAGQSLVMDLEKTIVHHQFVAKELYDIYDIALIKFKTPVKFNNYISPICLPISDYSFNFVTGTVAGWGKTTEGFSSSQFMLHADIRVLSNDECKRTGLQKHLMGNMMCASYPGVDACQGDSGGPLMYRERVGGKQSKRMKYVQIGIVSWGFGCASVDPGVYTRVSSHMDWIVEHTSDAQYCLDWNNTTMRKHKPKHKHCVYQVRQRDGTISTSHTDL